MYEVLQFKRQPIKLLFILGKLVVKGILKTVKIVTGRLDWGDFTSLLFA